MCLAASLVVYFSLCRVHQENRAPQDNLEIKGPQVQSVFLVLTDLVVILALM